MRYHNTIHSVLLLGAMTAMLAAVGYILAGPDGLIITALFAMAFMTFGRNASKNWMLRAIGAVKLRADQAPAIHDILSELSHRAGLEKVPEIHVMDSQAMMGFSAGTSEDDAVIVLSGPLVQGLSPREIAGVLAHEVSHIVSGDLAVMSMADMVTRMTRTLSMVGLFLALLNVPMMASGGGYLPWGALILLVMAPMVSFLLQMALSRAREFEADHAAVNISGDPSALARALEKLERQQLSLLRSVYMPHQPGTEPSLLRSHPITAERVQRILNQPPAMEPLPEELVGDHHGYPSDLPGPFGIPIRWLLRWWR